MTRLTLQNGGYFEFDGSHVTVVQTAGNERLLQTIDDKTLIIDHGNGRATYVPYRHGVANRGDHFADIGYVPRY